MKLSDVLIWIHPSKLSDPRIIEAIKDFGGIFINNEIALNLSLQHDSSKNLYDCNLAPIGTSKKYLGEIGTRRLNFPALVEPLDSYYADESSPMRLKKVPFTIQHLGYSSYRPTLFSIVTKNSDINIRMLFLSPIFTFKRLLKLFGKRYSFIWVDIKKSLHWCLPYMAYLDQGDKKKSISFFQFIRIPFDYHLRRCINFCDKNNLQMKIYGGDFDTTIEEVLEGIAIIKKYLS